MAGEIGGAAGGGGAGAAVGGGGGNGGANAAGVGETSGTGGGNLEGELSAMLAKQEQTQATIMKFNMESNLANAEHSNKKSMSDKIGNS